MTRRINAVDLDAILDRVAAVLAELSPEELAALAADVPADIKALADQAAAAQQQTIGLFLAAGDQGRTVLRTDIDEWVRFCALDTVLGWVEGRGRTCMHSPSWRRPEPTFSCAWKPGLVVCVRCTHLLAAVGVADRTCDRCGRECLGVEVDDPVYPGAVFIGEMAYEYGTCGDCRPAYSKEGAA